MGMSSTRSIFYRIVMIVTLVGLLFSLISPAAAKQAMAASARAASVVDVTGTAYVKKAGGTKPIRLYKKMTINQGDTIVTESKSSVVLSIVGRDDEVTIGENAEVYMADLLEDEGATTNMKVTSGSVYSKVSKLGKSDTYKIETPNATMGVRGTHFYVTIDPITGLVKIVVVAGAVEMEPNQSSSPPGTNGIIIYASMQGTSVTTGDSESLWYVTMFKEEHIDPAILEALIENHLLIQQENEEYISGLLESDVPPYIRNAEGYAEFLRNVLTPILLRALEAGELTEYDLERLIQRSGSNDLDSFHDLLTKEMRDLLELMNEKERQEMEKKIQELQRIEEERRKERERALQEKWDLVDRARQRHEEQRQENEQVLEENEQEAVDRYLDQLTEEDRQQFLQNREEARRNRQADDGSQSGPSTEPGEQPAPGPGEEPAPGPGEQPGPGDEPSPEPGDQPGPGEEPADPNAPAAELVLHDIQGDMIPLEVVLRNIPEGYGAAQIHLLLNAEHFDVFDYGDGSVYVEAGQLTDWFADAHYFAKARKGLYTWENNQIKESIEVVFAVLSTGEVGNGPIEEGVLLALPLRVLDFNQAIAGKILLAEIRFFDLNGDELPLSVTKIPVQYSLDPLEPPTK
jgi:hypothetical protein